MEAAPVGSTVAVTAAAEGSAETSSLADASLLVEASSDNALAVASRVILGTIADSSSAGISAALAAAASRGHLQVVTALIDDDRAAQTLRSGEALCAAAACGHIAIVALLQRLLRRLVRCEESSPLCEAAVAAAAGCGRDDVVWYLLDDPELRLTAASAIAFVAAARGGFGSSRHRSAALRLLADPRVDAIAAVRGMLAEPAVDAEWRQYALTWAAANGEVGLADRILTDARLRLGVSASAVSRIIGLGCHHPRIPCTGAANRWRSRDPRCCPADVLPIHISRCMAPRDVKAAASAPQAVASATGSAAAGSSGERPGGIAEVGHRVMPLQGAPFTASAAGGHVAVMRRLLEDPSVDPAARYNEALIAAAAMGHAATVDFLLTYRKAADADDASASASESPAADAHFPRTDVDPAARGHEALLWACYGGHLAVVDRLLADPRVDAAARCQGAVIAAAAQGHTGVIERLLADPRVDATARNGSAYAAAAAHGHVAVMELLQARGITAPPARLEAALTQAALSGHEAAALRLLEDPRVNPAAGSNAPLMVAASAGLLSVTAALLRDPRVNPSAVVHDDSESALERACGWGHNADVVRCLLADPRVDPTARDCAALQRAAASGFAEGVAVLLADGRIDDHARFRALLAACNTNDDAAVIDALLADPRTDPAASDHAAIHAAACRGNVCVLRQLLADPRVDAGEAEDLGVIAADARARDDHAVPLWPPAFAVLDTEMRNRVVTAVHPAATAAAASDTFSGLFRHYDWWAPDIGLAAGLTTTQCDICAGTAALESELLDAQAAEPSSQAQAHAGGCGLPFAAPGSAAASPGVPGPRDAAVTSRLLLKTMLPAPQVRRPRPALHHQLFDGDDDDDDDDDDSEPNHRLPSVGFARIERLLATRSPHQDVSLRHSIASAIGSLTTGRLRQSGEVSQIIERLLNEALVRGVVPDVAAASLSHGAMLHLRDDLLFSGCLRPACLEGNAVLVEQLLADRRMWVDPNYNGCGAVIAMCVDIGINSVGRADSVSSVVDVLQRYMLNRSPDRPLNYRACGSIILRVLARQGRADLLERLLAEWPEAPTVTHDSLADVANALCDAAGRGHADVVRLLLASRAVDPAANDNDALCRAAAAGHVPVVEMLLADRRVDPRSFTDNGGRVPALVAAAMLPLSSATTGSAARVAVVRRLLSDPRRPDPAADDNNAVVGAVEEGNLPMVQCLLTDPRVDPSAQQNHALHEAARLGRADIVRLLLADPRVGPPPPPSGIAQPRDFIADAACQQHYEAACVLMDDRRFQRASVVARGGLAQTRGCESDVGATATAIGSETAAMSVTEARVRHLLSRPRLDAASLLRAVIYPQGSPHNGRGGTDSACHAALSLAQLLAYLDMAVQPQLGDVPSVTVRLEPWTVPGQPLAAALRRALRGSGCAVQLLLHLMDHPALHAPTSPHSGRSIASFLSKHVPSFATMRAAAWMRRRAAVLARDIALQAADE